MTRKSTKTSPTSTPTASTPIPSVTSLALYRSGVAYVTRRGIAAQSFQIPLPDSALNDVLASVSTRGPVRAVAFMSQDALNKEITRRALPTSTQDVLLQICRSKLPGHEVNVEFENSFGGSAKGVTGRVLGVDTRQETDGDTTIDRHYLVLKLASHGLQDIPLDNLKTITPTSATVQVDLDYYADRLASPRGLRSLDVQVESADAKVEIGYLVPAALWRTTYDLSLKTGETTVLTPHAVVFNPLEEPLEGVSLLLTTGRPVSFRADLDTPAMTQRKILREDLTLEAPQVYAAGNRKNGGHESLESAVGGSRGIRARSMRAAPEMAFAASASLESASMDMMADEAIEESETRAEVGSSGEETEFEIKGVSFPSGGAVTLPLTRLDVPSEILRVYRFGQESPHPDQAVKITNGSLVLEQGPVTVTLDGKFVGQAVVPFSPPGKEILLAFSKDRTVSVRTSHQPTTSTVTRIGSYLNNQRNDLLSVTSQELRRTAFSFHSQRSEAVDVIVEMPFAPNQKLRESTGYTLVDTTAGAWRLRVSVAPGDSTVVVEFTAETPSYVAIGHQDETIYASGQLTDVQKAALETASERRTALTRTQEAVRRAQSAVATNDREIQEITSRLTGLKDLGDGVREARDQFQGDLTAAVKKGTSLKAAVKTAVDGEATAQAAFTDAVAAAQAAFRTV